MYWWTLLLCLLHSFQQYCVMVSFLWLCTHCRHWLLTKRRQKTRNEWTMWLLSSHHRAVQGTVCNCCITRIPVSALFGEGYLFFFFFCSSTLLFSFLVTIIVLLLWSVWKRLLKREWRVANGCLMWMKWKCIEFCLNFFCLFLFVSAFSSKNILRSVVSEYLSPQTLYVLSKKTCTSYQSCSLDLSPALLECTVTNTLHVFTSELL